MGNRKEQTRTKEDAKLNTALYIRLSREDGDKAESLSVANQRMQLMEFMERQSDLRLHDVYVDDGHTGTNFERPAFKRMIEDTFMYMAKILFTISAAQGSISSLL